MYSTREKRGEPLIVQQCKLLEEVYGTGTLLMQHRDMYYITIREERKKLEETDRDYAYAGRQIALASNSLACAR